MKLGADRELVVSDVGGGVRERNSDYIYISLMKPVQVCSRVCTDNGKKIGDPAMLDKMVERDVTRREPPNTIAETKKSYLKMWEA